MMADEVDRLTDRHNRQELIRELRTYAPDESVCNAAAEEMEEMMDELQAVDGDRVALQRAIAALIKISEPRVGGGQWAAEVAKAALGTMTCAGESEEDWISRYHKGQYQIERMTERLEELEYTLSRVHSAFFVVKEALEGKP